MHASTLRSLLDDANKGCILLGGILFNATIACFIMISLMMKQNKRFWRKKDME